MTMLGRVMAASIENPQVPLSSASILEYIGGGHGTHAGVRVNEEKSLALSAVYRSVNIIASSSAGLPLHAYRPAPSGGREILTTGQAAELLDNPHPDLTPFELWELAYAHGALWGNSYQRKLRDQMGVVHELWPIHPGRMKVGRSSETGAKVYVIDGNTDQPLSDYELLHIPGFGYDGICGVSPIRAARQGLGLALAAEEYGAKLFGEGSLATGILQTEQRLTQKQADALHDRWKARRSGLQNAHDTIVLDSGAQFHQLSIAPEDAQFLQTRAFQVEEIARWFGIPPHMLGSTEKVTSWGSGIEEQTLGFVTWTLRAWLTRYEQRITKILKPGPVYAHYAIEGLLRGNAKTRAEFYKALWEIGVLSTNDILALEERAPVEGGDARYRPLNMGELGKFDTSTTGAVHANP